MKIPTIPPDIPFDGVVEDVGKAVGEINDEVALVVAEAEVEVEVVVVEAEVEVVVVEAEVEVVVRSEVDVDIRLA